MARQGFIQNYHSFADGLVTDGNMLSSNRAVVRWAVNFHFQSTGEAVKRLGLGLEADVAAPTFARIGGTGYSEDAHRKVFSFDNVAALGYDGDVAVMRAGPNLYVFTMGTTPALADSRNDVVNVAGRVSVDQPMDIIKAQGRMMVLQPNSVRWIFKDAQSNEWRISDSVVSNTDQLTYGGAMVRDFEGVPDGLSVSEEPAILSANHRYNLLNQGWTDEKITEYFHSTDTDGYPSNAQVWHEGKDEEDEFSPAQLKKLNFGDSPAAKGKAIISAITQNRSGVFPGVNPTLGPAAVANANSGFMYTTGTAFSSRIALAGCNVESARRKVFISPVLENLRAFGTSDQTVSTITDPGLMVAGGNFGLFWTEDGTNWVGGTMAGHSQAPNDSWPDIRAICYHPSLQLWAALDKVGWRTRSSDGKVWQPAPSVAGIVVGGPTGLIADISGEKFVAVGNGIYTSTDGFTWNSVSNNVGNGLQSIAKSETQGRFVVAKSGGAGEGGLYTSTDLSVWVKVGPARGFHLVGRSDTANVWVAISNSPSGINTNNQIYTSTDGLNWTLRHQGQRPLESLVFSQEQNTWCAVTSRQNPNNQRIYTAPANGQTWTQRTTPVGLEWRDVTWWNTTNKFYAVAHNFPQVISSTTGSTWANDGTLPGTSWAIHAKPATTTTVVTDSVDDFFDRIFRFYQANDPTAEISNELLADDGLMIEINEIDSVTKVDTLANALLVFGPNGVWAVTGTDVASGFRTDDYMQYKVTDLGTRYADSMVSSGELLYYWADNGIRAVGMNEFGRFESRSITENRIDRLYDRITTRARRHVIGYYDRHADRVVWAFRDPDSTGPLTVRNALLILDNKTGGFSYHRLPDPADRVVSIIGFTQDPNYPSEDGTVPIKVMVEIREPGVATSSVFSVMEFNNDTFKDYEGLPGVDAVPFDARIDTWSDTLEQPAYNKQALWVFTYMKKTEDGFVEAEDGLVPLHPSGCMMSGMWDWHNSAAGGKWGKPRQIYRFNRMYIPTGEDDTYDTGQEIISTKNKVYGEGSALALRFDAEAGKDCQLVGYTVSYTANQNP